MNIRPLRLAAILCLAAGIVFVLFLQFVSVPIVGIGLSGLDTLHLSFWVLIPVIANMILAACCMALQNRIVGTVLLGAGAFLPLIAESVFKSTTINAAVSLASMAAEVPQVASVLSSAILRPGLGVILAMLCGFAAAILFFCADLQSGSYKSHSAGIEKDDENW